MSPAENRRARELSLPAANEPSTAPTPGVPTAPPFLSCPRFDSCACNACPLDPDSALHGGPRAALPDEERCRATRTVRERIAAARGLPARFALLPGERERDARRARWAALPPEVKERRKAGLLRGGSVS